AFGHSTGRSVKEGDKAGIASRKRFLHTLGSVFIRTHVRSYGNEPMRCGWCETRRQGSVCGGAEPNGSG
ncbi:hypothetical protein M3665_28000, partial [Bacillus licheniformis]|nr:hypothetical protein [Bacillus licheniformis]